MREDDRLDWQDNGEARHVGVRLDCGIRLENVYVPAGGDIPDRELNPKFGQKLDFIERMTRWSEKLAEPTIMVGDFNVAPLECDVWSHKQLLNVVSHTPIEVEALTRLQQAQRLGRSRPPFHPGAGAAASPGGATARPTGPRTTAAAGSTICGRPPTSRAQAVAHKVYEPCRNWKRPVRPCPADDGIRALSGARASPARSTRCGAAGRWRSTTCRSSRSRPPTRGHARLARPGRRAADPADRRNAPRR